jgi:hypothetical protein
MYVCVSVCMYAALNRSTLAEMRGMDRLLIAHICFIRTYIYVYIYIHLYAGVPALSYEYEVEAARSAFEVCYVFGG